MLLVHPVREHRNGVVWSVTILITFHKHSLTGYTVRVMDRNDLITILVFIFLIGAGLGYYAAQIYMSGG